MAFKFNPFTGQLGNVVDQASKTKYERADGSKKNIDAASDDAESALNNLDDAIGALDATPTNYSPADSTIVSDHLQGVDTELGSLSSLIQNFEWQPSVATISLTTPPGSPSTGDRYLIGLDTTASVATGLWSGQDGNIAEWDGSAWQFTTPTVGMFVSADDEGDKLYCFGGTLWSAKYFESTTASGFLSKSGFDIQLTDLNENNLIVGNSSNVATSIDTSSTGDIEADSTTGLSIKPGIIDNADINASAAIDATKIASGVVDNTEFEHLNGVTSAIQTQIDSKLETVTDTNSIDLTKSGVDLSADLRLSAAAADAGNVLISNDIQVDGLRSQIDPDTIPQFTAKADLHDPVSSSLPTGASAVIDGVTVVNGDQVLFTNLGASNNQIYEVSNVGVSLIWTAVTAFNTAAAPTAGDLVTIARGDSFAGRVGTFATSWSFNENIRLFDGANYQEISSIKKSTLTDNATTTVIDVSLLGSENQEISYSILRGTAKETGKLILSGTGSDAKVARYVVSTVGDVGITFDAAINTGDIELSATATSTGTNAEMTYFVTRWSDSTGGPGGIPNYAVSGSGTPAAGTGTGQLQYRGSDTNLAADEKLVWDETNEELDLGDLSISVLNGPITINDNQTTNAALLTFDTTSYNFAVIEYSIVRDTAYRTGRLLVWSDGTSAGVSTDHIESSDPGVTFDSDVSGTDARVLYTSTNTGSTGTFKYSIRKWS